MCNVRGIVEGICGFNFVLPCADCVHKLTEICFESHWKLCDFSWLLCDCLICEDKTLHCYDNMLLLYLDRITLWWHVTCRWFIQSPTSIYLWMVSQMLVCNRPSGYSFYVVKRKKAPDPCYMTLNWCLLFLQGNTCHFTPMTRRFTRTCDTCISFCIVED